jgi:hypothetical protein
MNREPSGATASTGETGPRLRLPNTVAELTSKTNTVLVLFARLCIPMMVCPSCEARRMPRLASAIWPLGGGSAGTAGAGGVIGIDCSASDAMVFGSYVSRTLCPTPVPIVEIRTFSLNPTATPCGLAGSVTERDAKVADVKSITYSDDAP